MGPVSTVAFGLSSIVKCHVHLSCAHMGHAIMVDWAYVAMNRT
jgi:hypothetical protein